jgi:hypothetical protein
MKASKSENLPSGARRRPAVRAASVHDVLAYLDKFELGAAERVRAVIPEDVLAVIEATPRLGWIDAEDDVYVPTAIWSVLGDADATEMMTEFLKGHFEIPLLRPLLSATHKLFGLTPINALRLVPSGWRLIYRDVCNVQVQSVDNDSCEIVLENTAELMMRSEGYLASFRAIFIGVIEATGYRGDATVCERNEAQRRVVFRLSWWNG